MNSVSSGNLAEELARCIRRSPLGIEDDVGDIAHAKLHAVVALKLFALHTLAVNKSTVLAAQVLDEKLSVIRHDKRVVAGNARVSDN
jgi:hypothetical protein